MLPFNQNTALILFTRTPQEEAAHKKIFGKSKAVKQRQLFRLLVQHAQQLGHQSGLPFFVVDSSCQQGQTFGERLQNAFAAFFNRGFAKVIAIGNDCVQLRSEDIRQAAYQLQTNQAVLGPAHDGGVYLLGLDQALFRQKPGFTEINWQTATVLSELQTWCAGSLILLPAVYADLDTFQEVKAAFAARQLPLTCMVLLAGTFNKLAYPISRITGWFNSIYVSSYSLRGPPGFLNF